MGFTVGAGGFRAGAFAARHLPVGLSGVAARAGSVAIELWQRDQRRMFERHLRRVDPSLSQADVRRASRRAFESYARYWVESLRLPSLSRDEVAAGFSVEGFEHVEKALAAGVGVVLALPHLGGWEWAGRWIADQGIPITVVVEPLEPPEVFDWFRSLREDLGMTVVPLGEGAAAAVLKALRGNGMVCLLSDRDLQGGGVEVEFLGERTTLPAGPAFVSLRSGAPVLPVGVYFTRRRDGHHAIVRPPLPIESTGSLRDDVERGTQLLADELAWLIRRDPSQWHLFQPNWPSDPGYGV